MVSYTPEIPIFAAFTNVIEISNLFSIFNVTKASKTDTTV
jgi:hypothetical protein